MNENDQCVSPPSSREAIVKRSIHDRYGLQNSPNLGQRNGRRLSPRPRFLGALNLNFTVSVLVFSSFTLSRMILFRVWRDNVIVASPTVRMKVKVNWPHGNHP